MPANLLKQAFIQNMFLRCLWLFEFECVRHVTFENMEMNVKSPTNKVQLSTIDLFSGKQRYVIMSLLQLCTN